MVVVGGCSTPCKRDGQLSGRRKCPENMPKGNMYIGKCPDPCAAAAAALMAAD